ncbi:MAG: inositol monophosphatase [Bacteroidales bacterium]|nr:inositol monophosphatase [Bacteroidales bacterium]
MNLENITQQVIQLAQDARQFLLQEVNKVKEGDVEYKGRHNLVTYVDKKTEEILVEGLRKIIPEAGFIAEENDQLKRGEQYNWIVDPLDGTTNFIHKIPMFCISIALADGDEIVSGVVYELNLNECFYAWKDGPAFLNGKEIQVSEMDVMDQSLIATGFPYYDYSMLDPYLDLFKDLLKNSRGIRRLGSAALDLAYVACGRFELFYEYGLSPWDVAAGALIVKQAGGKITAFHGEENYIFGKEIVASNTKIHEEFMETLNRYF